MVRNLRKTKICYLRVLFKGSGGLEKVWYVYPSQNNILLLWTSHTQHNILTLEYTKNTQHTLTIRVWHKEQGTKIPWFWYQVKIDQGNLTQGNQENQAICKAI